VSASGVGEAVTMSTNTRGSSLAPTTIVATANGGGGLGVNVDHGSHVAAAGPVVVCGAWVAVWRIGRVVITTTVAGAGSGSTITSVIIVTANKPPINNNQPLLSKTCPLSQLPDAPRYQLPRGKSGEQSHQRGQNHIG